MLPVYKILREQVWIDFQTKGSFHGSESDLKDGFIHLSTNNQVKRIINKYFSTERTIYVVKFIRTEFLNKLLWEPASNGDLYPHLYSVPLYFNEMDSFKVITGK